MHRARSPYLILILFFILGVRVMSGQSFFNQIKGARSNALANQGVAIQGTEGWPVNPASLGFAPLSSLIISGESRFAGSGIRGSGLLSTIMLNDYSSLGIGAEYYGLPEYHQQAFKIGYGRALSNRWSIGSNFQYLRFFNPSSESTYIQLITLGGMFELSRYLSLGGSVHFPFSQFKLMGQYNFPSYHLGLRYILSDIVKVYTEIAKDHFYAWDFSIAAEYQLISVLALRMGVSTLSRSFSAGCSIQLYKKVRLDVASVFYQSIGTTPSLSLKYTFHRPGNNPE